MRGLVKLDFSVTRKVIAKRVLKIVDSLVEIVRAIIFTVLTQKFPKFLRFSYFIAFRLFKNHENSVFGTKIVLTTSELNSTGSTYYNSTYDVTR